MKITLKELKEMIQESVMTALIKEGHEESAKQKQLAKEIENLLQQVREESGKAGRGEKHKSIDGLFKRIHAAREERNLLNRDEDA